MIEKDFYMQILCSSFNLNNEEHLISEAASLKCGHSICKTCIENIKDSVVNCRHCNSEYKVKDLKKLPVSNALKLMIKSNWKEIVNEMNFKLKKTIESLMGQNELQQISFNIYQYSFLDESINHEIEQRFALIENEIDLRVESIIKDLHEYRDEFRKSLDDIKQVIVFSC